MGPNMSSAPTPITSSSISTMSEKRYWTCQNMACIKRSSIKAQYRVCAACRGVSYCSRECQTAHWKVHKPACKRKRNEDALAALVSDPETDRKIVYARPGIVQDKLLEDLRKWSERNSFWICRCYLQASQLRTNPDFWRTHGVIVELNVTNTRQSRYRFTFKDARSASPAAIHDLPGGKNHPFKEAVPTVAPDGTVWFVVRAFIWCNTVSTDATMLLPLVPDGDPMPAGDYPDWKGTMARILKAPLGLTDAIARPFREWWSKQRSAIVFCCANILDMKPAGPVYRENIYFDVMYKACKNSSTSFNFSPLPPRREPMKHSDPRSRVPGGTIADLVGQLLRSRDLNVRVLYNPVRRGTHVVCSAGVGDVAVSASTYFVTDDELADIEIRDDWKHHFYTLLVDYDLKY